MRSVHAAIDLVTPELELRIGGREAFAKLLHLETRLLERHARPELREEAVAIGEVGRDGIRPFGERDHHIRAYVESISPRQHANDTYMWFLRVPVTGPTIVSLAP